MKNYQLSNNISKYFVQNYCPIARHSHMTVWGPDLVHRPFLFGPLLTSIKLFMEMGFFWPSDIYLWTVYGPLCPIREK